MVGRDLPKLCPHGEDHQGRRGARGESSGSENKHSGRRKLVLKSLIVTIQIHRALVWILRKNDLLAIHFSLQGGIWHLHLGLGGVMFMNQRSLLNIQKSSRWRERMHCR
jgi:hypothetical protein